MVADAKARGLELTVPNGLLKLFTKNVLESALTEEMTVFVFFLAFFLDFIEIAYIILPMLGPVADTMGINMIWFGVMLVRLASGTVMRASSRCAFRPTTAIVTADAIAPGRITRPV